MFLRSIADFIASGALLPPGARVLAGASGGLDSTVLIDVLCKLGYRVEVLHINFGLRGESSSADERFVWQLCKIRDLPCSVRHVQTRGYAQRHRVSVQMAARALRYQVFAESIGHGRPCAVAVGHQADDQAETVLLNLARGSGPEGLAGMPAKRTLGDGTLVRPLLDQPRESVAQYAHDAGLSWREDASNTDLRYRRAVLRQRVVPVLQEALGQDIQSRIVRSADLMREYVEASVRPSLRASFTRAAGDRVLSLSVLSELPPVWQRRLIMEALYRWLPGASVTAAAQIASLLTAQPGRRVPAGAGTVWRGRRALIFDQYVDRDEEAAADLEPGRSVAIDGRQLSVTVTDVRPRNLEGYPSTVAFADADLLEFPLLVRRWKAGDRMVPLGMSRSKKVSDVLTDARIRVDRRARARVVCSGRSIAWLIRVRLSEHFRVREQTRRFARFTLDR